jgi:2'-5' RNA ligase
MEKTYSIAMLPSESIIALIKSMKEQLAKEIGWFHSKNSVGHITICEFKANEATLEIIKNRLITFCDTLEPVEVSLTGFNSFPNGAFFMEPDEISKKKLIPIMKQVHKTLSMPSLKKSINPHLSIARGLDSEELKKANQLFTTIDLWFLCESMVLREFDENIKQFFVTDTFKFNNNPKNPTFVQGTLF